MSSLQETAEILLASRCRCGNKKNPKTVFCKRCYFSLPKPLQHALYRRYGEGFEQAYADAIRHLTEKGGGSQ